jgi:hypothetical protein
MLLYLRRWSDDVPETSGFLRKETKYTTFHFLRTRLEVTPEEYEVFKSSGLHARIAAVYDGDEATFLYELVDEPYFEYKHFNLKRILTIENSILSTVVELVTFIRGVAGECDFELVRE